MKFWIRWLALWLALGLGLRLYLLLNYPPQAEAPNLAHFFFGGINDLQSFLLVAGIVSLFGMLSVRVLRWAVFVAVAVSLMIFVTEIFFWLEFERRLDRLVFHYLAYPKEVLVFLEEQFRLSILVVPIVLFSWLLTRMLHWPTEADTDRRAIVGLVGVGLLIATFGQPIGQSNNRVAGEFASNGYLGVLKSARYSIKEIPWLDRGFTQPSQRKMSHERGASARNIDAELASKRHVVLIIEESFAGPVWEDEELRGKYLPNFSELAKTSISFSHLFATGSRTTRGLEALLNGFPPLPGISATERTGFERLPSLARGMSDGGFHPVFMYGGWPGFSNFSNYWRSSGFQQIWSREDFDETFTTSWGVADEALFDRLIVEMGNLTRSHERVFLSTLTVSHHRPYDFPQGAVEWPPNERRSEFAMAYADHALGSFFRAARKQAWYADTLFLVVADHGLHTRGDALIPAESYHIPLLMHANGVASRQIEGMGSSISLAKTLMAIFDIDTDENFAGENLLCDCDTLVPIEFAYHVGLLERDAMHVIKADGQPVSWVYDAQTNRLQNPVALVNSQAQQRVVAAFAPAYGWFYDKPHSPLQLTDSDYAGIVVDPNSGINAD